MDNDTLQKVVLDDLDFDEYLGVAFYAKTGGFSKGTANVSASDVKKLKGLLKHYAKMKHPFTACVRDNRKRFGKNTEAYCAVLKDLIVGNTKWRKQGKKSAKGTNLSEDTLVDIYSIVYPEDFFEWLAEAEIPEELNGIDLAVGDVAWNSSTSWNSIKCNIQKALNDDNSHNSSYVVDSEYPSNVFYVDDVNGNEALVCSGEDYYVVPFTLKEDGEVEISEEDEWTKVDREWVETSMEFSDENQIGAEMHLAGDSEPAEITDDGFIWKTILREGVWNASPGPGQKALPKPITVVKEGVSDKVNNVISMAELKDNFDKGLVEHVTIPTSHADSVLENTGYVKALRFDTDPKGRTVLKAAHQFTDPKVKQKVLEGSIANVSSGIIFDYVHKESGKKNSAVLGHVALTNHPWLSDLEPFGVLASENLEVFNFSEDQTEVIEPGEKSGGGEEMSEVVAETPKFLVDLGLSEEEVVARLAKYADFEARDREHTINAKVAQWEEDKKAPALVSLAKTLLSQADDSQVVLNLSENGKTVELSAVDIIDRFMDAAPALNLADDPVTDQDVQDEKPAANADDEIKLSQEERVLADTLFLEGGLSRSESEQEAVKRLSKSE